VRCLISHNTRAKWDAGTLTEPFAGWGDILSQAVNALPAIPELAIETRAGRI